MILTMVRSRLALRAMAVLLLIPAFTAFPGGAQHDHGHDDDAPDETWSCDDAATPAAGHTGTHDAGATPASEATVPEFDLLYIDMMLPHHESIIALSQAALTHLSDSRLVEIAEAIITAQSAENEQLSAWRAAWYGSPEPATDGHSMARMLEAMPVGTMDEMMREMDPAWQVFTFCAADDPDVAFARQTIRHHQMAVDVSVIAVEQAVHPELAGFAAGVIEAQQTEIDEFTAILAGLEDATPVS